MRLAVLLPLTYFFFLSCIIHGANGSKIVLESTPANVIDGLTQTLTLRCSLHDTAASASVVGRRDVSQTSDNVAEVSAIIVMRNGKDIASVSHNTAAKAMDGSTKLHVTGSVSGSSGERAFLQLTVAYPTINDTGEYQCEINTIRSGHGIIFSSSLEVNYSMPTMADLVVYIRDNDKDKEQLHHELNQTNQELIQTNQKLIQTNQELNQTNQKLNQANQELNQIKNQIDTTILFSVGITKVVTIPAGQTVIYDKIYANIGGGYNEKTGEFVCTTPGHYHFSFSAYIDETRPHTLLIIYHNTEPTFSLYGDTKSTDNKMLSNSGILTLAQGDVVKVVSSDQSVFYNRISAVFTTFTGHLLALV